MLKKSVLKIGGDDKIILKYIIIPKAIHTLAGCAVTKQLGKGRFSIILANLKVLFITAIVVFQTIIRLFLNKS
jgi:hypothetical protein